MVRTRQRPLMAGYCKGKANINDRNAGSQRQIISGKKKKGDPLYRFRTETKNFTKFGLGGRQKEKAPHAGG